MNSWLSISSTVSPARPATRFTSRCPSAGERKTTTSPRFGSAQCPTYQVVNGTRSPYASLFMKMRSPSMMVGFIEPDGTMFQSAMAERNVPRIAAMIANGTTWVRTNWRSLGKRGLGTRYSSCGLGHLTARGKDVTVSVAVSSTHHPFGSRQGRAAAPPCAVRPPNGAARRCALGSPWEVGFADFNFTESLSTLPLRAYISVTTETRSYDNDCRRSVRSRPHVRFPAHGDRAEADHRAGPVYPPVGRDGGDVGHQPHAG